MLRTRPSLWTFETSSGGSASGGALGMAGAGKGTLYLVPPGGGSVKFQYVTVGGGFGAGAESNLPISPNVSSTSNYSDGDVYMLESFAGRELKASDFVGPCMVVELSATVAIKGGALTGMLMGMEPLRAHDDISKFLVWAAAAQGGGQIGADALTDFLHFKQSAKAVLTMKSVNMGVGFGASLIGSLGYVWRSGADDEPDFPIPNLVGPEEIVIPYRISTQVTVLELAGDVLFAFDKAEIRKDAEPVLIRVGTTLKAHTMSLLFVNGHTDSIGSDGYNLGLSLRRAANVAQWFISHRYVTASKVQYFGLGKTKPKVPNTTARGRAQNRRVELRIFR
jgi:outer membrane protein OmpA-like peptidoglycan-associated protein